MYVTLPTARRPGVPQPIMLSSSQPATPSPAKMANMGACGKPGPPNSGSIPAVLGYKMAANPASQYMLPVNTAVRSDSLFSCAASAGVLEPTMDDCHVYHSVAAPRITDKVMVWPVWNLDGSR